MAPIFIAEYFWFLNEFLSAMNLPPPPLSFLLSPSLSRFHRDWAISWAIFRYKILIKMFISFPFRSMLISAISVLPYNFCAAFGWYVRCLCFPWYVFKRQYTAISSFLFHVIIASNFHSVELLYYYYCMNFSTFSKFEMPTGQRSEMLILSILCTFFHRKWKKRNRKSNKKRKIIRFLYIVFLNISVNNNCRRNGNKQSPQINEI